jgi:ABC-2 type transport system permease protein
MVVALNPRFIWSFAKFNGVSWIRDSPWSIVANVITPICLLVIIYLISGGKLVAYAIVGGVIAIIASSTLTSTGQSAMFRLEFRIQDLIIATRVSMLDYILGFVVANLVFTSPGIVLFTIFSIVFHLFTIQRFLTTVAVALLLALATTSIAVFVGSKIRRTVGMWSISGILSALFTLLPPTFYPYTVLPKIALYILAISPVTPAAIILQGAYGLGPVNLFAPFLLVAEVIIYIFIARTFGRWREK